MSNLRYEEKCTRCGKPYIAKRKGSKYCSFECGNEAYKEKMRIHYVGKREKVCRFCGVELPKYKTRFCSKECAVKYKRLQDGSCQSYEMVKKTCIVCGKEFEAYRQNRKTCSSECAKKRHSRNDPERDRRRYLKKHPEALTAEEYIKKRKKLKEEKEAQKKEAQAIREAEQKAIRAEKAKKKQENIDYWLNYEAEHACEICGQKFIAHYPTTKYCSDKCKKIKYKTKKRYKGISIDSDISLFKLAERDHNQCQICGLFVNWDDYIKTDKTIICGDMYPSIDHIRPISLGGLHSWDNVQLAHRGCNTRKSNRYIG